MRNGKKIFMNKKASFWKKIDGEKVQCNLCSHHCKIKNQNVGVCGVRENQNGELFSLIYGSVSSVATDPIEKKPLYHFHPGTNAFSLGTVGCNFQCLHCQNSSISTADPSFPYLREMTPDDVVKQAKQYNCMGVAWTYNEPTIWHEFSYDASKIAKKQGLYTVYVSNGYISEEPLRELSPYLDAMNIDIKAFTESFYKKICKAKLEPVLNTCILARELDIHIELTYLVIPTYNDSGEEITRFCKWVVENLGNDIPVHFSRFHPDHLLTNIPATPIKTLEDVYDIARKTGISYVYIGNVPHGKYENTFCPTCGNLVVERYGYTVDISGIKNGKCSKCDNNIDIVF